MAVPCRNRSCQFRGTVDGDVTASERFGEEVVALVQPRPGAHMTAADVREYAAETVARFKAPRAVLLCEHISRHPSGKADYGWAKQAARDAVEVAR